MATGNETISCLISNTQIDQLPACVIEIAGVEISVMIFFSFLVLFVSGWSLGLGISKGLAIGGFFGMILGVAMWLMGSLPIFYTIAPLILLILGIVLIQVERDR